MVVTSGLRAAACSRPTSPSAGSRGAKITPGAARAGGHHRAGRRPRPPRVRAGPALDARRRDDHVTGDPPPRGCRSLADRRRSCCTTAVLPQLCGSVGVAARPDAAAGGGRRPAPAGPSGARCVGLRRRAARRPASCRRRSGCRPSSSPSSATAWASCPDRRPARPSWYLPGASPPPSPARPGSSLFAVVGAVLGRAAWSSRRLARRSSRVVAVGNAILAMPVVRAVTWAMGERPAPVADVRGPSSRCRRSWR